MTTRLGGDRDSRGVLCLLALGVTLVVAKYNQQRSLELYLSHTGVSPTYEGANTSKRHERCQTATSSQDELVRLQQPVLHDYQAS